MGIFYNKELVGIGQEFGIRYSGLTPYQRLLKSATWAIDFSRPQGVKETDVASMNTRQINPVYDLVGNADVTLNQVGWTSADGYATAVAKGVGDEIAYTNIVTNPSFEDALTGNWVTDSGSATETIDSSIFLFGTKSLKLAITTSSFLIKKNPVNFLTGKRYYISANHRNDIIANSLGVRIYAGTTIKTTFTTEPTSLNVWKKSSGIYTTVGGETDISLIASVPALKNGNFWHDGAQAINLSDNPQVQAIESKLGRQLTASECDYLFAFTPTSATVKAKAVVGFLPDGLNTYGILPLNASNPTSGNFAFARTIKTAPTLVTQYFGTRAEQSEATCQYGFKLTNTGVLSLILEGTLIQIAIGIAINTWYDIVVSRIDGVLKVLLNGTEVVNQANAVTLTSRPNVREFALSTNVGGTTHTGFANVFTAIAGYSDGDEAKFIADWRKYVTQEYGL